MPHTAPSVGYVVQSSSGACVAFSGDTGGNLSSFFKDGVPPAVFFVEATFPNRLMDLARLTGHLTPDLLRNELEGLLRVRQGLPKVIVGHISLGEQYEVVEELSEVAKELGVDLVPAYKDMCITV